jgi:hypothetical protein
LYADGVVWLEIHHGNLSRVLIFAKITHLFEFSKLRFKNTAGFSTLSTAINSHQQPSAYAWPSRLTADAGAFARGAGVMVVGHVDILLADLTVGLLRGNFGIAGALSNHSTGTAAAWASRGR